MYLKLVLLRLIAIKAEHVCMTIPVVCLGFQYKDCKLVNNSPVRGTYVVQMKRHTNSYSLVARKRNTSASLSAAGMASLIMMMVWYIMRSPTSHRRSSKVDTSIWRNFL